MAAGPAALITGSHESRAAAQTAQAPAHSEQGPEHRPTNWDRSPSHPGHQARVSSVRTPPRRLFLVRSRHNPVPMMPPCVRGNAVKATSPAARPGEHLTLEVGRLWPSTEMGLQQGPSLGTASTKSKPCPIKSSSSHRSHQEKPCMCPRSAPTLSSPARKPDSRCAHHLGCVGILAPAAAMCCTPGRRPRSRAQPERHTAHTPGPRPEKEVAFCLGTGGGEGIGGCNGGQVESPPHCPCVPICKMGSLINRKPGAQ